MLSREEKAAIVNMALDAETLCYHPEMIDIILTILQNKTPECRTKIMQFLYSNQGSPLRLFLEIMRYLPSVSNEPFVSYKIK